MIVKNTFQLERIIETIPVSDTVSIYRDRLYQDDILFKEHQGIADNTCISADTINAIKCPNWYFLVAKEFVKKWNYEDADLDTYIIKKAFDNYDKDKHVVVRYDAYSEEFYSVEGYIYPKHVYFDYINGCIDNEYYDLKCLQKYLEEHPDKFINIKKQDIPYYNRTELATKTLSFTYIPDADEYAEYRKYVEENGYKCSCNYFKSKLEFEKFKKQ